MADGMTLLAHKRREFPAKVKLEAWRRCQKNGKPYCEDCGLRIVGRPEYDHVLPDAFGGEPTLPNCRVVCPTCHRLKTTQHDIPMISKADRIARKNAGLKPKRPWPKQSFNRRRA